MNLLTFSSENEPWVALSFIFFLYHHFQNKGLANIGKMHEPKRWRIRFFDYSCFLAHHFLSMFEASSGSRRQKVCPLGAVSVPAYSVLDIYLPCIHFESQWAPTAHCRSARILCSWGAVNAVCKWGSSKWWKWCIYFLCSPMCSSVPLDFTYKTEVKR